MSRWRIAARRSWAALLAIVGLVVAPSCREQAAEQWWDHASSVAASASAGALTPWPEEVDQLSFGVTPYLDRPDIAQSFQPVLEHLAGRLGVPVRLVVAEDYSDLGGRLRQQQVDLGRFSPLSYVEAKEADPSLHLLMTQVAEGSTSYLGYIFVGADDPASSLAELSGRSMCYVDPHSTSGYLYPRALLRGRGLDPEQLFSRTVFGGNHLACMRRVLAGESGAGVAYSGAISAARRDGFPVHRLKILGKTRRIPNDAYCARSGLPPAAAQRIKEELLRFSTRSSGGRSLLGSDVILNAWTEAQDSDYDSVREALASDRRAAGPAPAPAPDAGSSATAAPPSSARPAPAASSL